MRPLGNKATRTASSIAAGAVKPLRIYGMNVTRPMVAKAAGTSARSVVRYFPTLRSLIRATYADQIAALEQAIAEAKKASKTASNASELSTAIEQFISSMTSALERRPLLAMALLPYTFEPWVPERHKAPRIQGLTLDSLARTFGILLDAYWKASSKSTPRSTAAKTARYHVRAMISAAANKCTGEHIADPVLDAVL